MQRCCTRVCVTGTTVNAFSARDWDGSATEKVLPGFLAASKLTGAVATRDSPLQQVVKGRGRRSGGGSVSDLRHLLTVECDDCHIFRYALCASCCTCAHGGQWHGPALGSRAADSREGTQEHPRPGHRGSGTRSNRRCRRRSLGWTKILLVSKPHSCLVFPPPEMNGPVGRQGSRSFLCLVSEMHSSGFRNSLAGWIQAP